MYDLYAENFYLVDLKLSVCWETYEPCEFIAQLFKNKMLPKQHCPGNMTFEHSGKYFVANIQEKLCNSHNCFSLILFQPNFENDSGINEYIVFIRFLTE